MKKLIISGSVKLFERALYWRGYFEGRGYEVIDWPAPTTNDPDLEENSPIPGSISEHRLGVNDAGYAKSLIKVYKRYYRNLDQADVFFLMNEDRDGVEGYIGSNPFSELCYVIMGNLNRGKNTEIYILKMPDKSQGCYEKVRFWLSQGMIKIYQHPKKAFSPISVPELADTGIPTESEPAKDTPPTPEPVITKVTFESDHQPRRRLFHRDNDKTIDLATCKKKCLRALTPTYREYLKIFCPDFPAWLLNYIAAPEFQRLSGVSMTTMDYSGIFHYQHYNSVFAHSIGVALILWNFTHDKKATLAGLFHDIASPSFKHAIDYLNGDSEKQESIESRTGEIIRNSRVITRELKKDGILASEIDNYKLYPLADNDVPGLAADRLEYTFSNGYFLYETWNLADIKRFYENITVLTNESGLDEFGFKTPRLASEFATRNLTLAALYHNPDSRASLEFIADIIKSMISADLLTLDDLYIMTEREIIDWILSCGNHTISDAFRAFQLTTSAYSGSSAKRGTYYTTARAKVRYINPLIHSSKTNADGEIIPRRTSESSRSFASELKKYLATEQPKYVGFDFDFKPPKSK